MPGLLAIHSRDGRRLLLAVANIVVGLFFLSESHLLADLLIDTGILTGLPACRASAGIRIGMATACAGYCLNLAGGSAIGRKGNHPLQRGADVAVCHNTTGGSGLHQIVDESHRHSGANRRLAAHSTSLGNRTVDGNLFGANDKVAAQYQWCASTQPCTCSVADQRDRCRWRDCDTACGAGFRLCRRSMLTRSVKRDVDSACKLCATLNLSLGPRPNHVHRNRRAYAHLVTRDRSARRRFSR